VGGALEEEECGWHHSPRQKPSTGRRVRVVELTMISLVVRFQSPEVFRRWFMSNYCDLFFFFFFKSYVHCFYGTRNDMHL